MSEAAVATALAETTMKLKMTQVMGAALAISITAMTTCITQYKIGTAGCGAMAERPEVAGTVFILVALPETMVVLGFVVAAIIIFM